MNDFDDLEHPDALIIHANHYRFQAREQVKRSCVFSRLQLWCLSGRGSISVNNKRIQMRTGTLIILPWKHAISYHPDTDAPFYVAGIHLIPHCMLNADSAAPWFQTPHEIDHPLANVDWMQDKELVGLTDTHVCQLQLDHSLLKLSDYICDVFAREEKDETAIRRLSQSLLHEWSLLQAEQKQDSHSNKNWPRHFQRLCATIRHDPSIQRSLSECAQLAQCSTATLQRHAQKYLHMSLLQWQRQRQLNHAAELLRSSSEHITEIARSCGFEDPLYFSRVFKQNYAMAPRQFRNHYGLV